MFPVQGTVSVLIGPGGPGVATPNIGDSGATGTVGRVQGGTRTVTADTAFADVIAGCSEPRDDESGTWITGEMTAAYGVSRITVRQALGELQREGLIVRLQGKGAYVSQPRDFAHCIAVQCSSWLGLSFLADSASDDAPHR